MINAKISSKHNNVRNNDMKYALKSLKNNDKCVKLHVITNQSESEFGSQPSHTLHCTCDQP